MAQLQQLHQEAGQDDHLFTQFLGEKIQVGMNYLKNY